MNLLRRACFLALPRSKMQASLAMPVPRYGCPLRSYRRRVVACSGRDAWRDDTFAQGIQSLLLSLLARKVLQSVAFGSLSTVIYGRIVHSSSRFRSFWRFDFRTHVSEEAQTTAFLTHF